MFDLRPHCLSYLPNNEYITLLLYNFNNIRNTINDFYSIPLIPCINPVNGNLQIIDNDGILTFNFNFNPIIKKNVILLYFQLASIHNGLYKFYVSKYFEIHILLSIKEFNELNKPVFTPNFNSFSNYIYLQLVPKLSENIVIEDDYNKYFKVNLYNYQQNNIKWMNNLENLSKSNSNIIKYKKFTNLGLIRVNCNNNICLHNRNTETLHSSSFERELPSCTLKLQGGILCDNVGLGKTFSILGLIINNLENLKFWNKKPTKKQLEEKLEIIVDSEKICKYKSKASLILAPSRLIGQWKEEVNKIMKPFSNLKVVTITSIINFRSLSIKQICNSDIILVAYRFFKNTSYKKHCSENNFSLADFNWNRIILDEAHELLLSNEKTLSYVIRDAIFNLHSTYKWICSGTPFSNNYDNLNYYLHFLSDYKYTLYTYKQFDNNTITKLVNQITYQNTVESIKNQIQIPDIVQETVFLQQDPIERAMYVNATGNSTRMIQLCTNILISEMDSNIINNDIASLDDIKAKMIEHYTVEIKVSENKIIKYKIEIDKFQEILNNSEELFAVGSIALREYKNMQQNNIEIWKKQVETEERNISSFKNRSKLFDNFDERIQEETCVICFDEYKEAVLTKCSHIFCSHCIQGVINSNQIIKCPMCRTVLNKTTDIGYFINNPNNNNEDEIYMSNIKKYGTKMAWLVRNLTVLLEESGDNRIIIFSQWKKMLKLVGKVLEKNNLELVYLNGTANSMAKNISKFKTSKDNRIIMLSSETCSSGNNLTEATHIILLDTVNGTTEQSKSVEVQAIGRASRLGQKKRVKVIRLIMKNTIEHDYYVQNINNENIQIVE